MYLLNYLRTASEGRNATRSDLTEVEFRLVCSGELYSVNVLAADWRKSDVTRVLLRAPAEWFVVSQPFNSYPQEMALRFTVAPVTETSGNFSTYFLPDTEIAEDLCALLTLLSRRLIAPAVLVRAKSDHNSAALGSFASDHPLPLFPIPRLPVWSRRPLSVVTRIDGQQVISYDPPPVGVDSVALEAVLLKLPKAPHASVILNAARLYKTAMEIIETRPDISYQLLISTIESLANAALPKYEPSDDEMVEARRPVFDKGRELGLEEDKARQLAILACRGDRWIKRKFRTFLSMYGITGETWSPDRLFVLPEHLCPRPQQFDTVVGRIYDIRSQNLHTGSPFPRFVGLGTSPSYPVRSLPLNPLETPAIPPVPWFERLVSIAARRFIQEQTAVADAPFRFHDAEEDAGTGPTT